MRIGFIGAGRVGYSLAKYLNQAFGNVCGIYSSDISDAKDCAMFSVSEYYSSIKDLALNCDTLFLTVNDDEISNVVNNLIELNIHDKILIHTSGLHTSDIFLSLKNNNSCYSMHPIYAFSNKYEAYKGLSECYFTLEGDKKYISDISGLFPNHVNIIDKEIKAKYHAGCVMISNFICAIMDEADNLFKSMNLDFNMFVPLIMNNISNIMDFGALNALTGPVIRNDLKTVEKHLNSLDKSQLELYIPLTYKLIEMSEVRTNNDYSEMKKLLEVNKI